MTELKSLDENVKKIGQVQIADEVISIIAGTAALETEGIAGAAGNLTQNITELWGKRDFAKGVKLSVTGDEVTLELNVLVKFGYAIPQVIPELQRKVKQAIETMTGLTCNTVNINVTGLLFEKEKPEFNEKQTK